MNEELMAIKEALTQVMAQIDALMGGEQQKPPEQGQQSNSQDQFKRSMMNSQGE